MDNSDVTERGCGTCTSRRTLLGAGATAATVLLTGCQTYGGASEGADAPAAPATTGTVGTATPTAAPSGTAAATPTAAASRDASANSGAGALAQVADIPVGGGKIFKDKGVVLTQPQSGTIKAFSTVCTHAGCAVTEVKGGTINCTCHGSKFKVADGSVAGGPAPKGLAAMKVTVDGGAIKLG